MVNPIKSVLTTALNFGLKFGIVPSKMAQFVNKTGTAPTTPAATAPDNTPTTYRPGRAERREWAHSLRKRCTRNPKFHAKRWGGQADHRANHMAAHDKATLWPALVYHLRHTAFNK